MSTTVIDNTNLLGTHRAKVQEEALKLFEQEAPLYFAAQKMPAETNITEFGYEIPMVTHRAGGYSFPTAASPSFGTAVAPLTAKMYAVPMPVVQQAVEYRRAFNTLSQGKSQVSTLTQEEVDVMRTAELLKLLNIYYHGDGNGGLAVAASAHGAPGTITLTLAATASAGGGQTKGARFLYNNFTYQAINPATDAVRGTFTVTASGGTSNSVTATLSSGTIAINDIIVHPGSWKRVPSGIRNLISRSGLLQGVDKSVHPELNDPGLDLGGGLLTPNAFYSVKTMLQTRQNKEAAADGLTACMTFGQHNQIAAQGTGFRQQIVPNTGKATLATYGNNSVYVDGDTTFLRDADADDDGVRMWMNGAIKRLEEEPIGPVTPNENNGWAMWQGTNGTGSYQFFRAIGGINTLCKVGINQAAVISNASLGITQTGSY